MGLLSIITSGSDSQNGTFFFLLWFSIARANRPVKKGEGKDDAHCAFVKSFEEGLSHERQNDIMRKNMAGTMAAAVKEDMTCLRFM